MVWRARGILASVEDNGKWCVLDLGGRRGRGWVGIGMLDAAPPPHIAEDNGPGLPAAAAADVRDDDLLVSRP